MTDIASLVGRPETDLEQAVRQELSPGRCQMPSGSPQVSIRSRAMTRIILAATLIAVFLAPSVAAQKDVVVRTDLDPDETVYVGQRVLLRIDVLGKDLWANLPASPNLEIPGAVVYAPSSQSVRLNETISGSSYTGQRYEWWLYPLRKGTLKIPPIELDVQLKSFTFGEEPKTKRENTESISIEVTYPEGADASQDFLCMNSFSAEQQWKPDTKDFQVGDGITRTLTRTVEGAPGMLLSPVEQNDIPDVRVYWKQPEVEDKTNRGSLTGKRTESVTYVFESEGDFKIPEIQFTWWNVDANKLETTTLKGLEVQVSPATAPGPEAVAEATPDNNIDLKRLLWIAGVLTIIGVVFVWFRLPITRWLDARRAEYEASEEAHFQRFTAAAKTGLPKPTLRTLVQWWDSANSDVLAPRLDQFVNRFGDSALASQLTELETSVDADQNTWGSKDFVARIAAARTQWLESRRKRRVSEESVLPPLYG